jgi:hypothetical protein
MIFSQELRGRHRHVSAEFSATSKIRSDLAVLAGLVLSSQLWYSRGLGFYSDDWSTMAPMSIAPDTNLTTLMKAAIPDSDWMRPVQWLYSVILHWLFSTHPLGYHLSNGIVMSVSCALLYLILVEMGVGRLISIATALVYGFLPNYSTDRLWIAAFAAPLSVAWYLLSSYSDLRALRARDSVRRWQTVSLASLVISLLAYEHVLPLFVMNAAYIGMRKRRQSYRWRHAVPWTHLFMLAALVVFKLETTVRLPDTQVGTQAQIILRDLVRLDYAFGDDGFNLKQALVVNFGIYGAGLPLIVLRILRQYFDSTSLFAALLAGITVLGYLYGIEAREKRTLDIVHCGWLIVAGLAVFCGGYAIFLTNRDIQLTPTGIGNRNAIAASLGTALTLVGAVASATTIARARAGVCALAIGVLCACGFLILDTIGNFWRAAHIQQQRLLADIRGPVSSLPRHSTLLLDGICPYVGPAIVFENSWDFDGAVKMTARDPSLSGNVIRPRVEISEDKLVLCAFTECTHRYGRLFVYNAAERRLRQLSNADEARQYFVDHNPLLRNGCPAGTRGYGVPVF